jgi:twinkle protein
VSGHEECPCGKSSDGVYAYPDGGKYCFVCEKQVGDIAVDSATRAEGPPKDFRAIEGHYQDIPARGIKEKTAHKWGYQMGHLTDGTPAHIMNIRGDRRELIGQKFRTKDTKGLWSGPAAKNPPIYGSWLWQGKGKAVILTEGELDALSYDQAFDLKYSVGSLPNGTGSAEKAITRDYDKLLNFDHIYLSFDTDEPGQKALDKVCEMLPIGRVKIITLPEDCKDANEALLKHGAQALIKAFWNAKEFRPDGIVSGNEFTRERLKKACKPGYALKYPKLNGMLMGLRPGEITMLTAGSGIGKSTFARELAYDLRMQHGLKIGNIYLEESNDKTAQGYVALHAKVPLAELMFDPTIITDEQWDTALREVVHDDGMWFYDHFGSLASDRLIGMMRYMAMCGVKFIVLDHVSIVTSGLDSGSEGERKDIDILMTKLRQFAEQTGVGVIAIVHLKRKPGTSFNEGGQVSLNDFRGSASLEQLSDNAIALERDQQAEGDKRDLSMMRVLKCRITGDTGEADQLTYNRKIGQLELASPFDASGSPFDPHSKSDEDIPF